MSTRSLALDESLIDEQAISGLLETAEDGAIEFKTWRSPEENKDQLANQPAPSPMRLGA